MAAEEPVADVGVIGTQLTPIAEAVCLKLGAEGSTPRVVCAHATGAPGAVEAFAAADAQGAKLVPASSAADLCAKLKAPRCVFVFGDAAGTDGLLGALEPHLAAGDTVVDASPTSSLAEARRRGEALAAREVRLLCLGLPGSRRQVLGGASLVVSGAEAAWAGLPQELLQQLAASDGRAPCCTRVGGAGTAHLAQQVHDGLEASLLQLIGEAVHLLEGALLMSHAEAAEVLEGWGKSAELALESSLLELTRTVLSAEAEAAPVLDSVLDTGSQAAVVGGGGGGAAALLELGLGHSAVLDGALQAAASAALARRVAHRAETSQAPTHPLPALTLSSTS